MSLPLYTCLPGLSGIRAEDKHNRKQRKKTRIVSSPADQKNNVMIMFLLIKWCNTVLLC